MSFPLTLCNDSTLPKNLNREHDALFYVGFAFLYVKTVLSQLYIFDLLDAVDSILLFAGAFFLLLHCIQLASSYSRHIWLLALILAFLVLNYFRTGLTENLTAFLFVVAASYGIDRRRFVSNWFKVTLFLFIVLIVFYMLLYISGSSFATSILRVEDSGSKVRLSFFFTHPNGAANMSMMLVGAMLFLNTDKRLKFTHYVFTLMVSFFVFYMTDSKTSTLLTIGLVPLFLIYQNTSFFKRRTTINLIAILPILLFGLTYLLAGPAYSPEIASMFTGRIWLWHTTLMNLGITLLGRKFVPTSALSIYGNWNATAQTLDSFYASGLLTMGLVVSALFCWAVFRAVKFAKGDDRAFLPLLVVVLLHGFTEAGVTAAAVTFPLVFLACSLESQGTGRQVFKTGTSRRMNEENA